MYTATPAQINSGKKKRKMETIKYHVNNSLIRNNTSFDNIITMIQDKVMQEYQHTESKPHIKTSFWVFRLNLFWRQFSWL